MGVKSQEPLADREKEIQQYLQRMERVLTQAERMHSSTHVQPARRRHSLSNSQEGLKAVAGKLREDSSYPSSPEAPSASSGLILPSLQSKEGCQARKSGQPRGLSTSPQMQPRRKSPSRDPGDLLRQTAQDGGGLLDTSATLADWMMRSTGSSTGVSQRESDEAAEAAAELAAAPADVAYSSLLLESLSEWAARPDNGDSRRTPAGPFPRHKSPVSFPVVLSESASLSRATPSPERPRRVSHMGRPSASSPEAAAPVRPASETEDTADSGSSQDQRQSSDNSRRQHGRGASQQGGTGARRQPTPAPASSGSTESTVNSAAGPRHRASHGKPGASLHGLGPRSYREIKAVAQSRSPETPSDGYMQPGAAHPAKARAGESNLEQFDARQEACSGRDEPAAQVPALQKLKLRVRSRHRTSSQGGELPRALQALELADRQLPLAAEAAPQLVSPSTQLLAPEMGTDPSMQDGRMAAAGQPRSTRTGTDTAPAEEQLVFRATRTLPRSPPKGMPQQPAQVPLATLPLTPTRAHAAGNSGDSPHLASSPVEQAQPQCTANPVMLAGSCELGTTEACTEFSRSQQRSTATPDLTPSPQQQPESPSGSGVLAVKSLMFPTVSKAQRSSTEKASAIFTPSHKLARSPPRQADLLVTPRKDSVSRQGPCSFPQGLEAEELPETPRMRAAAQDLPEKHAGTCSGTQATDSPAHREDYRVEGYAVQQKAAGICGDDVRAARLPELPVLDCDQRAQDGRAAQKEAAHEDSTRHAGALPSRLPRPSSATSPRPGTKRPSSGGVTKLPSAPAGPPSAQSGQPTTGTRKALQQTDQAPGGCAADSVQATRGRDRLSRSPVETIFRANHSPWRHRNTLDRVEKGAECNSIIESMPDKSPSGNAPRSGERTPNKDRRRSTSPPTRPSTSPAAANAGEGKLRSRLRIKQPLPGSPPVKPAMRRRLSLGAPQRIRSPAQPNLEAPGGSAATASAAKSGSAEAARPNGAESPGRPRLQGSHVPERAAQTPSRLQGAAADARKSSTRASVGRDTVLTAVGKLPIDVIMSSMHGALMD